ncbi:hypothetical protein ACFQ0X_22555 [Streptomyces rectiviolaceus]|uniref:hypothetical protein n=1 Tax=Streptomyces rectiviolaceus TaxID=332591 RepID=UPI0031D1022C
MPRSAVALSVPVEADAEQPTGPVPGAEALVAAVGAVVAARTGRAVAEAVGAMSPARSA